MTRVRESLRAITTALQTTGRKPGEIWFRDCCSDADGLYTLAVAGGEDIRLTEAEFLALPDDAERVVIELFDAPEPDYETGGEDAE